MAVMPAATRSRPEWAASESLLMLGGKALEGMVLLQSHDRDSQAPAWLRFLHHFNDTLIFILLGAAAIKAVMGDWLDFWVIMTVAVINAVIGFVQEGRAEKALAGIRGMLSADATVRRGGA